jgi:hypothetical protein
MTTEIIIQEVANLAENMVDSPLYFSSKQVREGVEAILQAATAFSTAKTADERIDKALWLGEAYLILSSGLPDTGPDEYKTGWATANQIAKLIGGPGTWENRVREEFGNE